MADNIETVYDAENVVEEPKNENVVYDAEEEIHRKEIENGVIPDDRVHHPGAPFDPSQFGMRPEKMEEKKDEDKYEIPENQKNVFTEGLAGGQFLLEHHCPMCMVSKRSISELHAKKFFSKKKIIVGYMSICANCGFVSFYATDANQFLGFLRGKVVEKKLPRN